MKALFLLLFLPLCLARCPDNHFKDDDFKKCTKCTPCHITLTPCSANKDAVCASFNDHSEANHNFLKNRIHFFDDTVYDSIEEEFHSKSFVPHEKDHHKKNSKHSKSKHEEKHHHKKHFEFDDDDDDDSDENYDNYNDDFDFNFEKIEKPKKHKKHYEFNKKYYSKKLDDVSSSEDEMENEKLHFILGKDMKKNKRKPTHPKKIDVDEEELEELLLQSQKKFKMRKDNLLKTLKDEKIAEKSKNKVRLNSPVLYLDNDESYDTSSKLVIPKVKKTSDSDALKALADLNDDEGDDEEDDLDSFLPSNEESYKPVPPPHKANKKTSNQVVGQGKEVDDMLRSEMGKNFIYEKTPFNVIPFVAGKDFNPEKKMYPQKYQPVEKKLSDWEDEGDGEEYREIKTNEVVSLPFTAAETLVWDWQAVAVASAVASCLVFFLVVAIYFIVNTRHWKKVNKSYNRELEEVTTRIALMQPMLEMGASDFQASSLYMENIVAPQKDEEKKDVKV